MPPYWKRRAPNRWACGWANDAPRYSVLHARTIPARGNRDPQYNLVSWALNSFGVPLDDFLPGVGDGG